MHAVDRAKEAYNSAGYHRNFLEQKAKKGDEQARAELPEAQQEVEAAQKILKQAQTQLARLTGGENPHRRQPAPKLPEEKSDPTLPTGSGEEKKVAQKGSPKQEKEVRPLPGDKVGEVIRSRASFIRYSKRVDLSVERVLERLQTKEYYQKVPTQFKSREELLKYLKEVMEEHKKSPPRGEMLRQAKFSIPE